MITIAQVKAAAAQDHAYQWNLLRATVERRIGLLFLGCLGGEEGSVAMQWFPKVGSEIHTATPPYFLQFVDRAPTAAMAQNGDPSLSCRVAVRSRILKLIMPS